jgi:RHS repeat-associated protein
LFLVDDRNPTGYAQVLEEIHIVAGTPVVSRVYAYGSDLISQDQPLDDGNGGFVWAASFYGYDGHGNVSYLTDANGNATDTYDFDAFGTLVAQTGTTPNSYLYCGEQFDADLGLYYNRARYLNTDSGRFWTRDVFEGTPTEPLSLHKYLYAGDDPGNNIDPNGQSFIFQFVGGLFLNLDLRGNRDAQAVKDARRIAEKLCHISAVIVKPLNATYNQVKKFTKWSGFQAHHVVQDAAMIEMLGEAYSSGLGFAIPLLGGDALKGSPHYMANQYQKNNKGKPIYEVAYGSLLAAGCSKQDAEDIVEAAKAYNELQKWSVK